MQCGKGESSFATLASRGDSDAVYDVESVQHTAFHHIEYRAEYVHEQRYIYIFIYIYIYIKFGDIFVLPTK